MSHHAGPVRWGILGTAAITNKLLAGARLATDVEVVAAGSRTPDRAAAYAAEHGIPRAHGSYEALLADPDVDAVYICLPNSMHHPWTLRAIAAGKHVLCEKPYTRHPADVDEAFSAAGAAGVVLQEAFMWRHSPQTRRLLELMEDIGEVQAIRATFAFAMAGGADDTHDIRLRPDLDGGSLMDVGCYCVSGSRLLAGAEPDWVLGVQTLGKGGVDKRFSGLLHFPNGLTAQFVSGFTTDHDSLEVIGSAGSVMLPDPWHARAGTLLHNHRETRVNATNPYQLELEDMDAAIRGDRAPLLGRDDALGQARTIEALYRSAANGGIAALAG